jgi:hypothetical protein
MTASIAGLVLAMLVLVPHTADFFTQVLPHIGGGTTVYENKSFPAMVGRFFDLTGEVEPGWGLAAPDSKLVTLATLGIFLGSTVWLAARTLPRDGMDWTARAAVLAAFVAAMPIVSTITWRHYMVVNILAMSLLLPALWPIAGPAANRIGRWLLVASYPLSYIEQDLAHRSGTGARPRPPHPPGCRARSPHRGPQPVRHDLPVAGMPACASRPGGQSR